jgi:DNA-binding response OmpR family regulator
MELRGEVAYTSNDARSAHASARGVDHNSERTAVTSEVPPAVSSPVLVVDDEPGFRRFVATLLERVPLPVIEASSGAEASEVARSVRPRLVVVDVRLPDVSGLEVCRELRERLGVDLPVILVSGEKVDDLDRSAGLLLGADDYFVKPIEPTHFIGRVRRLVSSSPKNVARMMQGLPARCASRPANRRCSSSWRPGWGAPRSRSAS